MSLKLMGHFERVVSVRIQDQDWQRLEKSKYYEVAHVLLRGGGRRKIVKDISLIIE